LKLTDCFGRELLRNLSISPRKVGVEVVNQQRHVFQTLPKRRHFKRNYIQAVKKIRAKFTLFNLSVETFVGSGDDPHVHFDGVAAADGLESLFFKHA
jgi:hypothetical protein